jgi:hypothetical protein
VQLAQLPFLIAEPPLRAGHDEVGARVGMGLERRRQLEPLPRRQRARHRRRCDRQAAHEQPSSAPPEQTAETVGQRAVASGEHEDDEVAEQARALGCHQRRAALAQAQHDHLYPGHGREVRAAEAVHDGGLEPGEQQGGQQGPPRPAHHALGGLALDDQVGVLGRAGRACEVVDDGTGGVKGDVGEDLVGPRRLHHVEDVPVPNGDCRGVREALSERGDQASVLLDGDHPAAPLDQALGHQTATRAEVQYEIARLDARCGEQAVNQDTTAQKVLGVDEMALERGVHGSSLSTGRGER